MDLSRRRGAFIALAAFGVLTGCGGAQNAINAVLPQAPVTQSQVRQSSGPSDLLYVVTSDQADMLTYPGDEQTGILKGFLGNATSNPNNGNVLFDNFYNAFEYVHGGSKPIADFIPGSGEAYFDAAFDPTSSNIALTAIGGNQVGDAVAVYSSPSSNPAFYYDTSVMPYMDYLCYDNQGNLFVTGSALNGEPNMIAELPKGSSTFINITLNKTLSDMKDLRWDGSYITVASGSSIYQLSFSGSSGTVVNKITPKGFWSREGHYWVQGSTLIAPHTSPQTGTYLGFWHYPAGGPAYETIKTLSNGKKDRMMDVTVSVNP